jgi:hypothetical protein
LEVVLMAVAMVVQLGRIPSVSNAGKLFGLVRRLEEDGLVRQLPRGGGFELTFLSDAERAGGE